MPSTILEPVTSKSERVLNLGDSHDAILQFLNRVIGDLYFPEDSFTSTVDQWNGIPIVFASTHPDLKAFDEDRANELARIGGKLVGDVQHSNIVTVGHPRLMGQLRFTDGGEMSQHINKGQLSLSTGFWCRTDRRNAHRTLVGNVKPNHVLVFVEDLSNQPKDQGSVILNKQERRFCNLKKETTSLMKEVGEIVEEEQVSNIGKVISSKNCSRLQKVIAKMKAIFGTHQEAITDMEGLFGEMTAGGKDVNGDYQSILPPTGATDTPEMFASGGVTNDMLNDAVNYPATAGMGDATSMKQKAETQPAPSPEGGTVASAKNEDDSMDEDMKNALTGMGFKPEDGAAFITQLKQMMDEKKAAEDRATKAEGEVTQLKQQLEEKGKAADEKPAEDEEKAEEAEGEPEEMKEKDGGIMGMFKTGKTNQTAQTQKIAELTQKVDDMKFEAFKNKLPKGMFPKTAEAEKKLRKEWDEDREAVTNKVLDAAKGFKPGTQEEGVTNTASEPKKVDPIEEIKNKKSRGIGTIKFGADGSRIWED